MLCTWCFSMYHQEIRSRLSEIKKVMLSLKKWTIIYYKSIAKGPTSHRKLPFEDTNSVYEVDKLKNLQRTSTILHISNRKESWEENNKRKWIKFKSIKNYKGKWCADKSSCSLSPSETAVVAAFQFFELSCKILYCPD